MSFRQKLEEKALWFVIGIAVATLAVYLDILQLFGLSVVRRDDFMLRRDVAENYIRKDDVYQNWISNVPRMRPITKQVGVANLMIVLIAFIAASQTQPLEFQAA